MSLLPAVYLLPCSIAHVQQRVRREEGEMGVRDKHYLYRY